MEEETVSIPLRSGQIVLISEKDRDLSFYSWHVRSGVVEHTYYTGGYGKQGKQKHASLRRIIAERMLDRKLYEDERVTHKNRNFLDCQRENIQIGRPEFYQRRIHRKACSRFHGVRKVYAGRWMAVFIEKRQIYRLGIYDTAEEAAWMYNVEAEKRGINPMFFNAFSEEEKEKLKQIFEKKEEQKQGVCDFTLQSGETVHLSVEDKDLSLYNWHVHSNMGVARRDSERSGRPYIFLKRVVAERMKGHPLHRKDAVLHKDRDIYNLRRENLEVYSEEEWRTIARKRGKEQETQPNRLVRIRFDDCVIFDQKLKHWLVLIPKKEGLLYLGPFATKDEAIQRCKETW